MLSCLTVPMTADLFHGADGFAEAGDVVTVHHPFRVPKGECVALSKAESSPSRSQWSLVCMMHPGRPVASFKLCVTLGPILECHGAPCSGPERRVADCIN